MSLLNLRTGKANADGSLSECYIFYTPRPMLEGESTVENFVGKAARDFRNRTDPPVKEHGGAIVVPSLSGYPPEIGGQFATANYQVKEGVILKILAKKKVGDWNSAAMKVAIMFIRVRDNAALRQIKYMPHPSNALALDYLGIQGRFDTITLAEAEGFGAKVAEGTRKQAQLNDGGLLTVTILEEELTAPATMVETTDGRMRAVVKRRRRVEDA